MKLQPCEGCVFRVDTGREWPKGTPYYECHRRAPVIFPNEDGVPMDCRPGANGMGCGDREEPDRQPVIDVLAEREVTALETLATVADWFYQKSNGR